MTGKGRRDFLKTGAAAWGTVLLNQLSFSAERNPAAQRFFEHQAERREELWGLLGDLPPRNRGVTARLLRSEPGPGYIGGEAFFEALEIQNVIALSPGRGNDASTRFQH